jgi:glycosyltransferase involved in cell wall biosynthesis
MLSCGLPVASTMYGDIPTVLADHPAAVLLQDTSNATIAGAAARLMTLSRRPEITAAARATAVRCFDLAAAAEAYDSVYASVMRTDRALSWPDG